MSEMLTESQIAALPQALQAAVRAGQEALRAAAEAEAEATRPRVATIESKAKGGQSVEVFLPGERYASLRLSPRNVDALLTLADGEHWAFVHGELEAFRDERVAKGFLA